MLLSFFFFFILSTHNKAENLLGNDFDLVWSVLRLEEILSSLCLEEILSRGDFVGGDFVCFKAGGDFVLLMLGGDFV
jgi:hypothetical protein